MKAQEKAANANAPGEGYSREINPSGIEPKNRRFQCLSCTHRIEIFAQECDLAILGTQEHNIILAVDTSRRLDEPFCFDFSNGALRIGKGIQLKIEESKILHGCYEPVCVTENFLSS